MSPWLLVLLLVLAAVLFGLGFVVKWLFIAAVIAVLVLIVTAAAARTRT
ncbi:MAG: hydrophobic protein [Thermoleophilia bacterium]|nr:hydrophobic protein [Thermoleophilia bacterium]